MALFQINFFSNALGREVNMAAVVPMETHPEMADMGIRAPETFKPIYLLHGMTGSCMDWLTFFPLPLLAAKYGLAMIMLNGENSFYMNDNVLNYHYEDFVCEEFPAFCRKIFSLSPKREDTSICGISMGGFGALHNGLTRPDVFGNIIALSPALIIDEVSRMKEGEKNKMSYEYYRHVFGPPSILLGNHADPKALAKKLSETPGKAPRIYQACGSEDFLIGQNRDFHQYLQDLGIQHEYTESPGIHDPNFWIPAFSKALEWLDGGTNV
ncbi:MAG: esterase family protein [Treponema sp.]|jgi:S-formylglutathione hydrolase FrmB|nr:esterase family protein [Treponema sp.]